MPGVTEDCSTFVGFGVCATETATTGTHDLGSVTYHDVQVIYRTDLLPGLRLTAGVNKVFDQDPPTCLTCSLNGLDASTYDLPGRVWYARGSIGF